MGLEAGVLLCGGFIHILQVLSGLIDSSDETIGTQLRFIVQQLNTVIEGAIIPILSVVL